MSFFEDTSDYPLAKAEAKIAAHRRRISAQDVRIAELERQNRHMRATLFQFSNCELTEANCASMEVATQRIRGVARAALAAVGEKK